MRDTAPLSRDRLFRLVFFVCVLAIALGFILFPFSPASEQLEAGDRAGNTLIAPEGVSYESAVVTEARRRTAAAGVAEVIELDASIREQQLATLDERLNVISEVRESDEDLSQQQAQLAELANPALDDALAIIILQLADDEWASVELDTRRVLGEILAESVDEAQAMSAAEGLGQRFSGLNDAPAIAATQLLTTLVVPNVVLNGEATELQRQAARDTVEPVRVTLSEGEVLVRKDEVVSERTVEELTQADLLSNELSVGEVVGVSVVSLLAAASLGAYLIYMRPPTALSDRRLFLVVALVAGIVFAAKLFLPTVLPDDERRFYAFMLPVATVPMLVAALLDDTPFAVLVAAVVSALCTFTAYYLPESPGVLPGRPLDAMALYSGYFAGSLAAVFTVSRASTIAQYFLAGIVVTIVTFAGGYSVLLLDPGRELEDAFWVFLSSGGGGVLAAVITLAAFVTLGALFGITTRLQLMEMAQLNHPLLRRLQDEAPGTFHHSALVSNLSQAAAEAIGADALQTRMGAYFHDIGKMAKPRYYIENEGQGRSPHDDLDPIASAKVISDHVRNGLELARKHNLPQVLRDFIPQHHGRRLVTYFYRKAAQAGSKPNPDQFRYPGPRPQRRETAIVMLADSSEALVRAAEDKSPEAIDFAVEGVIRERLQEGELDESDLTLRDLQKIAEAFKSTLRGVYHQRIQYPEPTPEEQRALEGGEPRPDPFAEIS